MPRGTEVLSQINDLKIKVGEVQVHPLYGVQNEATPLFKKGKGTREEIQAEANRRIALLNTTSISTEYNARSRILNSAPQLSLDCSGFVFHVLDGLVVAERGKSLANFIEIPAAEVREAAMRWEHVNPLSNEQQEYLNERKSVLLAWDCERTGRTPQSQMNVKRFANELVSQPIEDLEQIEPGDIMLLYDNGRPRHVGLVAQRNGAEVQVWDSGKSNNTAIDNLGGVGPHDVTISALQGPIQDIHWSTSLDRQFDKITVQRPNPFI